MISKENGMMTIPPALLALLQKAIYEVGKQSIAHLMETYPTSIAIKKVCDEFSDIENLKNSLEQFLSNDNVKKEIDRFNQNGQDIGLDTLVETLSQQTSFYMGNKTLDVGQRILARFFDILFEEILKGEQGHVVTAKIVKQESAIQLSEHEETQRGIAGLKEEMAHIRQQLDTSNTSVNLEPSSAISSFLKKRIDEAKELMEKGKHETAKQLYINIVKDIEDKGIIDNTLLFRAHNNIGSCDLSMGHDALAADSFIKAHSFLPDDIKAQSNAALAYFLKQDFSKAMDLVNQALAQKPDYPHALAIKANILIEEKKYDDAIKLFDNVPMDKECYQALGIVYLRMSRYEEATRCVKEYLKINGKDTAPYFLLGQILFQKVQEKIKSSHALPLEVATEDMLLAREVKENLTKGIMLSEGKESCVELLNGFINRAAVSIMLGDFEDAIADCETVLKIQESNSLALQNKAVALFLVNKYPEAAILFEQLINSEGKNEYYLSRLAYAHIADGQPEKAINLLQDDNFSIELKGILIEAYLRNQEFEKAKELLDELSVAYPENSEVLSKYSQYYKAIGNDVEFKKYLEKAIEYADSFNKKILKIVLADYLYYDCREYLSASQIYEEYINPEIDSPQLRCYLACLFNTGRYGDCVKAISAFKKNNEAYENILEIEAASQQELGNLQLAHDIYAVLYKKYAQKFKYLIGQGKCLFRMGKTQEAIRLLEKVKNKVQNDPEQLMVLAETYDFIGDRKTAIELAFEALKQRETDPHFHMAYIRLFLRRDQKTDEKIDEKYIKAFQNSIQNFNEMFPEEKAIQKFDVGENFKELFKKLDECAKGAEEILQLFKANKLPIYVLSKFRGKDFFVTWVFIIASPDTKLWVCRGTPEEAMEEGRLVAQRGEVIIDIFSLFTFCYLKLLPQLMKFFSKIYVTQSVQDELLSIIAEMQTHTEKGLMTIGKMEDKYVREEVSPEDIKHKLDFLNEIKDFVKDKLIGLTEEYNPEDKKRSELLTNQAVDMFLLSKQKNIPVCCDDRAAILLGRHEYDIQAFSSYCVLIKMLEIGMISADEFHEKVIELLKFSYSYIPVSTDLLMYALKKNDFKINDDVKIILAVLENPDTREDGAVNVAMTTIFQIWFSPILLETRLSILDALLSAITLKRNAISVINVLRKRIIAKFKALKITLPIQSTEIMNGIDSWVKSRIIIS